MFNLGLVCHGWRTESLKTNANNLQDLRGSVLVDRGGSDTPHYDWNAVWEWWPVQQGLGICKLDSAPDLCRQAPQHENGMLNVLDGSAGSSV